MRTNSSLGNKYGRLLVLELISSRKKSIPLSDTKYKCLCDCGKETIVSSANLYSGSVKSCGCLQKELLSIRSRKPIGHASGHAVWNYYQRNAKSRNIKWELTKEQFLKFILNPCRYCNHSGRTKTVMRYGDWLIHNGIDRINSNSYYTVDNCVSCCKICNFAKNELSEEEFKNWIKQVHDNLFNIG